MVFQFKMSHFCVSVVVSILLVHLTHQESHVAQEPRIGIIGAGVAGTTTAYYLHELLPGAHIDVYEEKNVGGRVATVTVGGREFEAGGSVLHHRNFYMKNFTDMLGLSHAETISSRFGIYDGNEMVFDGSSYKLLLATQFFWHYGLDIYNMNKQISSLLDKFARVYKHQDAGYAFTSVEQLLSSMNPDFIDLLHVSTGEHFQQDGYSKDFIEQVVSGGLRSNYGQDEQIHAFVGSVSMAGIEPGLWSVKGGNKQVPVKLLEVTSDRVNLIKTRATAISYDDLEKTYTVETESGDERVYDYIVIATPLHSSNPTLTFDDFPEGSDFSFPHDFHQTVATFVKGVPNATKFAFSDVDEFPGALLTCNDTLFFNSIGRHTPVDLTKEEINNYMKKTQVYKIFSQRILEEREIDELFTSFEEVKVVDWLAYPQYSSDEQEIPPFQLHDKLFYTNAIEIAASAMEMSAIAGRNVALLIYNTVKDQSHLIDPYLALVEKEEL